MNPDKLTPEIAAQKIEFMLDKRKEIRSELKSAIPRIKDEALLAGETLTKITD